MKKYLAMFVPGFSANSMSATLVAPGYSLQIKNNCPEGHVTCEDVDLVIILKSTGKIKDKAKGHTLHSMCSDDSPCRFLGYEFVSGAFTYIISEGENLRYSWMPRKIPFIPKLGNGNIDALNKVFKFVPLRFAGLQLCSSWLTQL